MMARLLSVLGTFLVIGLLGSALALDCSEISATIENTQDVIVAPPQAIVRLSNSAGCESRVSYKKSVSGSNVGTLVTQWSTSAEISVLRLSPGLTYEFAVLSRDVGSDDNGTVILSTTLSIPASLWPYLTDRFNGFSKFVLGLSGTPTWDMVALDVHANDADPMFDGFVFVDGDGDIVWLWNITTLPHEPDSGDFPSHCIDQRDDYSFVLQTMVAKEPLSRISPHGKLLNILQYDPSCLIVTHEARLNSTQNGVLSVQESWGEYSALNNPQAGDKVVSWDFENGDLAVLYDLFDYFDPVTERGYLSNGVFRASCNSTESQVTDDWSHMNSVSVSAFDGSLIVSIRHLSTVCSFQAPPLLAGINWCISSELPQRSNYTFDKSATKFYDQHAVEQLASGNLIMFDNGDARVMGNYSGGGTTSRGLELNLDRDTMVASVVWEFPVTYDSHEGSVYPLDNGHFLIHEPNNGDDAAMMQKMNGDNRVRGLSRQVEVDSHGTEVASLYTSIYLYTAYRGVPFSTLLGEVRQQD